MAVLCPTEDSIANLRPRLNPGEERVLRALSNLDDDWRVFVQPRLRMDQPDFVAVHERYGVCIIEVKDWAPGLYRQRRDGVVEVNDRGRWQATDERPRLQAHRYRRTVIEHFFASPGSGNEDWPVVRAAVVLPQFRTAAARRVLWRHHLRESSEMNRRIAVWGGSGLVEPDLIEMMTGYRRPTGMRVDQTRLRRLEYHLAEPEVVADQRRPLEMSPAARNLARNPSRARIRRARGPAGSGKSLGLAARAARLAAEGKRVLVLSFNITLPHYLHDLAARHGAALGTSIRQISFTHFHGLCARAGEDGAAAGIVDPAANSELAHFGEDADSERIVDAAIASYMAGVGQQFDAILVDEGQDFTAKWWNFLRTMVLVDDGEMLLVADTTQDLYGRSRWTEESTMRNLGFRGVWTELSGSYRMPPDLVPIVAAFGRDHLTDGAYDPPLVPSDHPMNREAAEPTSRTWTNIDLTADLGRFIADVVFDLVGTRTLQPADIVFLCEEHLHGLHAAELLEAANLHLMHVFTHEDDDQRRRRKHRFWGGADGVKGCTVHSFKGWEARGVVLCILPTPRSKRLAYVALTRVKGLPYGPAAVVRVLNCDRSLDGFKALFEREFTVAEVPALGGQRRFF